MNYAKAIATGMAAAGYAFEGIKYLVDHSGDITKSLNNLVSMLGAAEKLMDKAADVVSINELLAKAGAESEDAESPDAGTRDKASPSVQPKTPALLRTAAEKVAGFKDEQVAGIERKRLEREMLKAVHDSKQKVLENATKRMTMAKLGEQLSPGDEAEAVMGLGVLDAPGCFAIARYPKVEFGKDLTGYSGIFVGKDDCVGEGIAKAIARTGNADVYADIKYRQNVWVYVFSCSSDKLDEKYEALVQLLEANKSYNRAEDASSQGE